MRYSHVPSIVLLVLIAGATGCGSSTNLEIRGKLTKKGTPYQPPPKMLVTLVFVPEKKDSEQTYPASFASDTGIYSVEVPPGQYRTRLLLHDQSKRPFVLVPVRPEFSKTVFELTGSKTLDLEIEP